MKLFLATLLLTACQVIGALTAPVTVRSRSGQFTVQGLPSSKSFFHLTPTSGVTYVRLDPTVLAVSSENIKDALLDVLQLGDHWQGRVSIFLRPVTKDDEEIVIASIRYTDGWQFRIQVPEQVDKSRLMKAVTEVLLLELSHRNAGDRRLDLPPWLAPGLAAHLGATESSPLIVEQETRTVRQRRMTDALKQTRELLRDEGGLSLNEMNWPDQRTDPASYHASAHLFVHFLLRKGGGALLHDLLSRLPDHLNWQTAFLKTCGFNSLRDADKWWTLNLVQFAGRDSLVKWSLDEAGAQLEAILNTPAQVRLNPNELPITTDILLQQVLQEWDWSRQSPLLRQKLIRLEALRYRAPAQLAEVIDGYRHALSDYISRRERFSGKPPKSFVTQIVRRLNDLDVRRQVAMGGASGAAAAALSVTGK